MESALAMSEMGNVETQYKHFDRISSGIAIESGIATCKGNAASKNLNGTTRIVLTLQKRAIGTTSWGNVCSWSDSAKGLATAKVDEKKAVSRGYDYRLRAKCTVSDSEGVILESATKYSSIVQVP